MTNDTDTKWVSVPRPFGEVHQYGCCTAFVIASSRATVCGWPRLADGSCANGHPAQSPTADTYSLSDLAAASRVATDVSR